MTLTSANQSVNIWQNVMTGWDWRNIMTSKCLFVVSSHFPGQLKDKICTLGREILLSEN